MISDQHKCIFIHIPKTAGTSIEKALGHFSELHRGVQDHRTIRQIQPTAFSDFIELIKNKDSFGVYMQMKKIYKDEKIKIRKKFKEYYKFCFVRNPWSRVHSWYKNVMRDEFHKNRFGVADDCTFKEFVFSHLDQFEINPQLFWIKDRNGKIAIDFIGRFENLEEDFSTVANELKLKTSILPKLIVGGKINYQDEYDNEMIEVIRNKYAEEIELFNYQFE
jgi:hypothetical protein